MKFLISIGIVLLWGATLTGLYYSFTQEISKNNLQKLYLESAKKNVLTRTGVQLNTSIVTIEHDGCLFVIAESPEGISIIHHPKCLNHD